MTTNTRPSPLERAARAAYTRSDSTIPWERRSPSRRAYWRSVAHHALDAALDRGDLARELADEGAIGAAGLTAGIDLYRVADHIRAHVLAPVVTVLDDTTRDRLYGEGYDGLPLDEFSEADRVRQARRYVEGEQQ